MSWSRTGNTVHDNTCLAAEGVRQIAVAGAAGQVQIRNAEIAFYRSVKASCIANNNYSGVEQAMTALRELGVNS
jgi:hypothetical protein